MYVRVSQAETDPLLDVVGMTHPHVPHSRRVFWPFPHMPQGFSPLCCPIEILTMGQNKIGIGGSLTTPTLPHHQA